MAEPGGAFRIAMYRDNIVEIVSRLTRRSFSSWLWLCDSLMN